MTLDVGESQVEWHLDFDSLGGAEVDLSEVDDRRALTTQLTTQLKDRFEIRGELGAGGMGVVYRAFDRKVGREVALKLIKAEVCESGRRRLAREGAATARLTHPGVVRVHGAGEAGGQVYLVYELISGGRELKEAFEGASLEARLDWLEQVASALGAAHAVGIVHRDVKGENVLLDEEGRVRILDFGLAHLEGADRLTLSGAVVGTPYYMSPERFAGAEIQPTQDVWSFGVLLYLALTGCLPFAAGNLLSLLAALKKPPLRPRRHDSTIPQALEAVCLRCLAHEPGERYRDGAEVEAALREARSGASPRSLPTLGLALLGAAVAVTGLVLGSRSGPREWESEAELEAFLARAEPSAWREAHARDAFATSGLKARISLALAKAESLPRSERLRLARSAAEVAPSGELSLLQARLLGAEGRGGEAARLLLEAREGGVSDSDLREVLVEAFGERASGGNEELARALLARSSEFPQARWLGPSVEALLSSGQLDLAGELLEAAEPGSLGEGRRGALGADLALARGEDPRPLLERALARAPSSATLTLRLSLASFRKGDAKTGLLVLGRQARDPDCLQLSRLWEAPNSEAPREWRAALASCLLLDARAELALSRRSGALPPEVRHERIRVALERIEALGVSTEERQALAVALGGPAPELASRGHVPAWAAALLAEGLLRDGRAKEALADLERLPGGLRGRLLLSAGRRAEALPLLEEAAGDLLCERATVAACLRATEAAAPERASQWRARLAKIDGEGREAAKVLFARYLQLHRQTRLSYAQEEALLRAVLVEDPYLLDAHHYLERARFSQGQADGLERALHVASRAPRHLAALCGIAQRSEGARSVVRVEDRRSSADPLTQGFFALVELEGKGVGDPVELVSVLDHVLGLDPGDQAARTLRGFAALRAGRLGAAAADLERVVEDEPQAAQARFYLALVAGARKTPDALLEHFRRAKEAGYRTRGQWRAAHYPELRPYVGRAGFEVLKDGLR